MKGLNHEEHEEHEEQPVIPTCPRNDSLEPPSISSCPSCSSWFMLYQRNFKVESPNRTSIIVMIQNLTTTWFSFQPFNS